MDNHQERNDRENSLPGEGYVPLLHGPITQAEQIELDARREQQTEKDAEASYKDRQLALAHSANRATWTNIILTFILAIFTAIGAGAAWYQGVVARKAAIASQKAADAAKLAADVANESLKDARLASIKSDQQFKTQLSKLEASVAEASRLATATERANANIIESDRPWMGGVISVTNFASGSKPTLNYTFQNSGKRPARIEVMEGSGFTAAAFPSDIESRMAFGVNAPTSRGVVVPGGSFTNPKSEQQVLTQRDWALIKSGGLIYFAVAKLDYRDMKTSQPYYSHVCVYWRPIGDSGDWQNCKDYNDAQ